VRSIGALRGTVENDLEAPKDLLLSRQSVLDVIRATMVHFGLDSADIEPAAHLVDDLDLDSLDWVDLAMQLEETLPITLRDEKLASVSTVQDLVDRVHAALVEARGVSA
jgi:acyl carrier protein